MMPKRNSLYSNISKIIKNLEASGKKVISANRIAERAVEMTDMSDLTRGQLELRCSKAETAICLYQHGYRSVIRRYGFYVIPKADLAVAFLTPMHKNAKRDVLTKRIREMSLKELLKEAEKNTPGQTFIAPDGSIKDEPTVEDILALLEAEAM
jgi:hypothetical protein